VPTSDSRTVRLGITVAQKLRKNRKITRITRPIVNHSVSCTSEKLALIDSERSLTVISLIEGGMPACKRGSIRLI